MEKHSHKDIPGTAMGLLYKIYLQYVASATGQLYLALKAVLAGKDWRDDTGGDQTAFLGHDDP